MDGLGPSQVAEATETDRAEEGDQGATAKQCFGGVAFSEAVAVCLAVACFARPGLGVIPAICLICRAER